CKQCTEPGSKTCEPWCDGSDTECGCGPSCTNCNTEGGTGGKDGDPVAKGDGWYFSKPPYPYCETSVKFCPYYTEKEKRDYFCKDSGQTCGYSKTNTFKECPSGTAQSCSNGCGDIGGGQLGCLAPTGCERVFLECGNPAKNGCLEGTARMVYRGTCPEADSEFCEANPNCNAADAQHCEGHCCPVGSTAKSIGGMDCPGSQFCTKDASCCGPVGEGGICPSTCIYCLCTSTGAYINGGKTCTQTSADACAQRCNGAGRCFTTYPSGSWTPVGKYCVDTTATCYCPATCGDGTCNGAETASNCPSDCGGSTPDPNCNTGSSGACAGYDKAFGCTAISSSTTLDLNPDNADYTWTPGSSNCPTVSPILPNCYCGTKKSPSPGGSSGKANGQTCTKPGDCQSNNCVGGVCCNSGQCGGAVSGTTPKCYNSGEKVTSNGVPYKCSSGQWVKDSGSSGGQSCSNPGVCTCGVGYCYFDSQITGVFRDVNTAEYQAFCVNSGICNSGSTPGGSTTTCTGTCRAIYAGDTIAGTCARSGEVYDSSKTCAKAGYYCCVPSGGTNPPGGNTNYICTPGICDCTTHRYCYGDDFPSAKGTWSAPDAGRYGQFCNLCCLGQATCPAGSVGAPGGNGNTPGNTPGSGGSTSSKCASYCTSRGYTFNLCSGLGLDFVKEKYPNNAIVSTGIYCYDTGVEFCYCGSSGGGNLPGTIPGSSGIQSCASAGGVCAATAHHCLYNIGGHSLAGTFSDCAGIQVCCESLPSGCVPTESYYCAGNVLMRWHKCRGVDTPMVAEDCAGHSPPQVCKYGVCASSGGSGGLQMAYLGEFAEYETGDCNSGLFIAINEEGVPIKERVIVRSFSGSDSLTITSEEAGAIKVIKVCFEPFEVERGTTYVLEKDILECDKDCKAGEECSCSIKDCEGGLLLILNKVGAPVDLMSTTFVESIASSDYTKTFTPSKEGVGYAMAICFNQPEIVHKWHFSVSE
ncbi:MAG: hypothetical protein ACP5E4_03485, partial [Candidatus Aenigmatarchaeota archaeon]